MSLQTRHSQRGATLIISLVLLLIITLLAISSMREVTLEERIVGNLRDKQTAFNAAESALREGEIRLANSIGPADTSAACSTSAENCVLATIPSDVDSVFESGLVMAYKGSTAQQTDLYSVADDPRWFSALIGFDPADSTGRVEVTDPEERSRGVGPYYYQVNARSPGRSQRMTETLQSVVVQRY